MKTNSILLFSILVSVYLFTACGGNTKDKAGNDIVGKWKSIGVKVDPEVSDSAIISQITREGSLPNSLTYKPKKGGIVSSMVFPSYIEFSDDGKVIVDRKGEALNYTISEGEISLKVSPSVNLGFEFKGDSLVLLYDLSMMLQKESSPITEIAKKNTSDDSKIKVYFVKET